MDVDHYPLPKPDELLASLAKSHKCSKLNLSQVYQQLLLDDESKKYTKINTHQGLRLPCSRIKTMDMVLQGILHVVCYLEDILVTGAVDAEHLHNLEEVFRRHSLASLATFFTGYFLHTW